jgi:hypothetical protein
LQAWNIPFFSITRGTNAAGRALVPGTETQMDEFMSDKAVSGGQAGPKARTNRLKDQIDENLRRVYQEALEEKLPDRFAELLETLRRKEGPK